jgi:hypothetical protein
MDREPARTQILGRDLWRQRVSHDDYTLPPHHRGKRQHPTASGGQLALYLPLRHPDSENIASRAANFECAFTEEAM